MARLNQVNLPYAIICDLDLLLQGQIIYSLKKNNILLLDMLLWVCRSSPPIKLTATIYWNIVESGVKRDEPKPNTKLIYHMLLYVTLTFYFKFKLFIIWRFFFYISWHASPGAPVFSSNKTDRHDMLKVALNTINLNQSTYIYALIVIVLSKY